MNPELLIKEDATIHRNLKLSVLLGPIRMLMPALLNMILYAWLIRSGGIRLVGVWASIQLMLFYFGALDLGLGRLIQHEIAARSISDNKLESNCRTLIAVYCMIGATLIFALLYYFQHYQEQLIIYGWPRRELIMLVIIVIISAVLTMISNLESAILIGNHKLYLVQWIEILQSVTHFIVSAIGLIFGYPVAGLVIGLLLSLLCRLTATCLMLYRYFPHQLWLAPRVRDILSLIELGRRAKYFSTLYVAEYFRYPLIRLIILSSLGTVSLGIYDMANKIPQMLRDAFGSGLNAIFPAFSSWKSCKNKNVSIEALRGAITYVSTTSVFLLGLYYAFSQHILSVWIGSGSSVDHICNITKILTVWWLISSYMIPYWWAALGLGLVKSCSLLYWFHVMILIIGWRLGVKLNFGLAEYAWILLVTGVIIQLMFFMYLEKKTRMLSSSLNDRKTMTLGILSGTISMIILIHVKYTFVISPQIDKYIIVGMFAFFLFAVLILQRKHVLTAIRLRY